MINLLADSTYFLASALKYPSTMNFSGIVPKLHNVNKNNAFPVSCINKNELNGPGSGISIMGGLYSHLLYVHTDGILYWTSSQRGWQPHPIHRQPDGVLYWASSHHLFFIECFHTTSMKRDYGPDGDQSKKKYQKKLPDRTRCHGLFFCWSLGWRFGDMMRNSSMDAWMHDCMVDKMMGRK